MYCMIHIECRTANKKIASHSNEKDALHHYGISFCEIFVMKYTITTAANDYLCSFRRQVLISLALDHIILD